MKGAILNDLFLTDISMLSLQERLSTETSVLSLLDTHQHKEDDLKNHRVILGAIDPPLGPRPELE